MTPDQEIAQKVEEIFRPKNPNSKVIEKLYKAYPLEVYGLLFNFRGPVFYVFDYETHKLEYKADLIHVTEWLRRNIK